MQQTKTIKFWGLALLGSVLLWTLYAGMHHLAKHAFMLSEPLTLPEISRLAEVQFPPATTLLDNQFTGGLNRDLIAKIQLPSDAVQSFWNQPRLSGKSSTTESALTNGLQQDALQRMHTQGWKPDQARHFRAVDITLREGSPKVLHLLLDLDDPTQAILYLFLTDG